MLIVAVPVYGLQLGASPLVLGAVLSTQYLLPLLLAIPLGGVVTRYGGRATLIAGGAVVHALLVWLWRPCAGPVAGGAGAPADGAVRPDHYFQPGHRAHAGEVFRLVFHLAVRRAGGGPLAGRGTAGKRNRPGECLSGDGAVCGAGSSVWITTHRPGPGADGDHPKAGGLPGPVDVNEG